MPQRRSTVRVEGGPQGDDAYIAVRKLRYGDRELDDELMAIRQELQHLVMVELGVKMDGDQISAPSVDGEEDLKKLNAAEQRIEELQRQQLALLLPFVVEWNWVDDEGEAMPLPHESGKADLYREEVEWLGDSIYKALFPDRSKK